MADLNGDGAQDLVLVLNDGRAWVLYREAPKGGAMCARAALAPKGAYVGPLVVNTSRGEVPTGAWNVTPGTAGAFLGLQDAGPVLFQWRAPGRTPSQRQLTVETKSLRLLLET